MRTLYFKTTIAVLLILFLCGTAAAKEKVSLSTKADALVKEKKYEQAANLLKNDKNTEKDPEQFLKYVRILVDYYATTINFRMFALRDLQPDETIEDVRGSAGTFAFLTVDLGQEILEMEKKLPDSPYPKYAAAYYISKGLTCGCLKETEVYDINGTDEFDKFLFAYKKGLYDGWSLFRMGYHYHEKRDIDNAEKFYAKSLAEGGYVPSLYYNYAAVKYQKGDYDGAIALEDKAIDEYLKYKDKSFLADAYQAKGRIFAAKGGEIEAIASFKKALDITPWHDNAFYDLASLLRKRHDDKEYEKLVKDYIAMDYGNSFMFNVYIELVGNEGVNATDRSIEKHLLALSGLGDMQTGALYFNLGRFADVDNRQGDAVDRCRKSLAAFRKLGDKVPKGAIEALERRLAK